MKYILGAISSVLFLSSAYSNTLECIRYVSLEGEASSMCSDRETNKVYRLSLATAGFGETTDPEEVKITCPSIKDFTGHYSGAQSRACTITSSKSSGGFIAGLANGFSLMETKNDLGYVCKADVLKSSNDIYAGCLLTGTISHKRYVKYGPLDVTEIGCNRFCKDIRDFKLKVPETRF